MNDSTPQVAPFESCVSCFKGDTTTAFAVRGEAEVQIAALIAFAGLPEDQATATFKAFAEMEMGCDPGKVPDGVFDMAHRLCRDCAAGRGKPIEVGELPNVPLYQPRGDEGAS